MERTVRMKVYISDVLHIPSSGSWWDLGMDYGVYYFIFKDERYGRTSTGGRSQDSD